MADPPEPPKLVVAHEPTADQAVRRGAIILVLLAAAALMVNYVETMLVPALPTLVVFFDGVPYTTIAWVVSAYLLVGVSTTPIIAKLGDIYGKKRMLIVVLSVYTAAVAVTGFTPSSPPSSVSRGSMRSTSSSACGGSRASASRCSRSRSRWSVRSSLPPGSDRPRA